MGVVVTNWPLYPRERTLVSIAQMGWAPEINLLLMPEFKPLIIQPVA